VGPGFPLSSDGPLWLRANVQVGREVLRLDERTRLQVALPLGFGWTRSEGAFSSTSTVYGFELLPQARLSYQLSERLRLHGELGLGVVHYRFGFEIPALGNATGSSTGLGFRFGAGLEVGLTDRLAVLVDPSLLAQMATEGTFRFGNTTFSSNTGVGTQASVLLGVCYRL
jgi:opacity protein-like surface antigen